MTVGLRAISEFVRMREKEMMKIRYRLIGSLGSNELVENQQHAELIQLQGEEPFLRTMRSILEDATLTESDKVMFLAQEADLQTEHEPAEADMVGGYRYYAWQTARAMLPVLTH